MAGTTIIQNRFNRPAISGKYHLELRTVGGSVFRALCAEYGCDDSTTTAPCTAVEVPKQLRLQGWTMTGVTSGALWWCPAHRKLSGR